MYKKVYNILIIIVLLLTLYGCKNEEEKKEHIISDDVLSSYILVQTKTFYIYNFEDELEKTTRFNIEMNVENKTAEEKSITYDIKVKNILGEVMKFESKTTSTLPAKIPLIKDINVGGNGIDEFIYKLNDGTNRTFYEKAMYITNKDIDNKGYPDELVSDVISINFETDEDNEKYNMKVIINSPENLHIDLQSFLVSSEATIYSFFGLYGYNSNIDPYYIENNYIYKEMDMKFLYLRVEYYDLVGNKVELRAKYALEELL